ncbi:MAG: hypothetical protein O2782_17820, partial [bacterium]|nr:hypothetical protein [bacterium]
IVLASWALFRAQTPSHAVDLLGAMAGLGDGDGLLYNVGLYLRTDVVLALAFGCLASLDMRRVLTLGKQGLAAAGWRFPHAIGVSAWLWAFGTCSILAVSLLLLSSKTNNPFIYFRF